jgi:hypothetical protein
MDDLTRNQNRAHITKGGSRNMPSDMHAGGGVAGVTGPGDLPNGILGLNPMLADPHRNLRNSHFNLENKPAEKPRAARMTEIRRRLEDRTPRYKY